MFSEVVTVSNKLGLHARASSKIVSLASQFNSQIWIQKGNRIANAKSIMSLMMLAANYGSHVEIKAEGIDAELAINEIVKLFNDKFGEAE